MPPNQNNLNIDNQTKKYFVLLVGINDYPDPISTLYGCIKDIDKVEAYLKSQVKKDVKVSSSETPSGLKIHHHNNLHICRLENNKATYKNIVKGFREFLCQAKPEDIVWFHFSGHGSEQFTAKEFIEIEPNGKDQTLVCYQTNEEENFHLADKELAFLIHEVENSNKEDQNQESPHIIVTLDCCHSGTGTRDFEINPDIKSRKANFEFPMTRTEAIEKKQGIRSLDSYVGDYANQWKTRQRLEVPLAKHVLLSACESVQLAGDMSAGGVFTSGLINALNTSGGNLNYADLFTRTRVAVQKVRHQEQTPQFETLGEFDPYTRFLEGSAFGSPRSYEVFLLADNWLIACGAIHGVPLSSKKPTQVEIYTAAPDNKLLGKADLISVGAQRSVLHFKNNLKLEKDKDYQAQMRFLSVPPVLVWIHGASDGVNAIKEIWDESNNIQLVGQLEDFGETQLEVEVTKEVYHIKDRRKEISIIEWPRNKEDAELDIIDMLRKIVNWERTLSLQNEKSAIKDWFNFEIDLARVTDLRNTFRTIKAPETIVEIDELNFYEKEGAKIAAFIPFVRSLNKPKQNLYFYLFHLRANYSITSYEGVFIYRPKEYEYNRSLAIPLLKKIKAWGLSPGEQQSTTYFKLFITTEPLDYQALLQSGIDEGYRGEPDPEFTPFSVKNDWYSVTLKVVLEKPVTS